LLIDEVNTETQRRMMQYVKKIAIPLSNGFYMTLGGNAIKDAYPALDTSKVDESLDILYQINVALAKVYKHNYVTQYSEAKPVQEMQKDYLDMIPPGLKFEIDSIIGENICTF